jgi:hypothetical protein
MQVPFQVWKDCSQLMAHENREAAFTAQTLASLLMTHAAEGLPLPAAGATTSSSSSSSGVMTMLWKQIEQSGLLQQLPGMLRSNLADLQISDGSRAPLAPDRLSGQTFVLLSLLSGLQHLQPKAQGTGQQFVVPAMQLAMKVVQHISTACSQTGKQDWMEAWLAKTAQVANNLLRSFMLQHKSAVTAAIAAAAAESSNRGGSSSSNLHGAVVEVLKSEHTLQWLCLDALVPMLAQLMLKDTAPAGSSRRGGSSSSSSGAAAPSHQHDQRPSSSSSSSSSSSIWQPEALAPSMRAAYSNLLDQLGCSREVGLWLALIETKEEGWRVGRGKKGNSFSWMEPIRIAVMRSLHIYSSIQTALKQCSLTTAGQQRAAPHLSFSAACLQWLSNMPPGRLADMGESCAAVCMVTSDACAYGLRLLQQQRQLSQQQQALLAGDAALAMAASTTVARLSAAVLEQLLREWRSLSDSGQPSAGGAPSSSSSGSSSSSSSSSSSGSSSSLLPRPMCCQLLLFMLSVTSVMAPEAKLLQDSVRMVAHSAAEAAAAPSASRDLPQQLQYTARVVEFVARLLADIDDSESGLFIETGRLPVVARGSLVAPLVAAGDVSSSDAMELFGLLCSMLKAHRVSDVQHMPLAVTFAVCSMVDAAVSSSLIDAEPGSTAQQASSSSYGSSSSGGGSSSSASTAALPWLVLLGRCCYDCAGTVHHWQAAIEPAAAGGRVSDGWKTIQMLGILGTGFRDAGVALQQLQGSLGGVVQWLATTGTVQQLDSLGYQPVELQQQLAAATQALQKLSTSFPSSRSATAAVAVFKDIQAQLQAAGSVLTSFAIPYACNNPACGNVCGASEAQLVGGRSCICAGCLTARYCGRACQRAVWRSHRPVCKALGAAAAAAAAPAAAASGAGADGC